MSKRRSPEWKPPINSNVFSLCLYNSLTRQKEKFIPQVGNQIKWYSCGPTVYDASHMGHARSYISFDILRRVLSDYFGYDITYVMNITDIDDKIIKRARQNYLFEKYITKNDSYEEVLTIIEDTFKNLTQLVESTDDNDKCALYHHSRSTVNNVIKNIKNSNPNKEEETFNNLLMSIRDPLSGYLDSKYGHLITENSIFSNLSSYWENEFLNDMDSLNVLRPNVLTRVSEYIPEIIEFIQQIIDQELAYESNGSVYFDVGKFNEKPNHFYAKLVPEAYGDTKSLQDGEGELFSNTTEKKSPTDFALWKASKAGEPSWKSPWGNGRPGWHIECSVMASNILGCSLDIHCGGVDLKFPHHDNELAQAEAYFNNDCWVRYFLHSGHLTISGCKMSKSLKNFITIKEALQKYSARQLRFAFLLHSWKDTLDYSENTMEMALNFEKFLNEFFLNVKDLLKNCDMQEKAVLFKKWTDLEIKLNNKFLEMKQVVHNALCDNIDTRTVLYSIKDCVTSYNIYVKHSTVINLYLIQDIALYIHKIMQIFGIIPSVENLGFPISGDSANLNMELTLMPYLRKLAEFRDVIRTEARLLKVPKILEECDKLRDDVLPNLGVRLEDKEDRSIIKLVDRNTLLKEKEEKRKIEQEKLAEKQRKLALEAEKEALKKIPPAELFRRETDKYSVFDEKGLPTHDVAGKEISKGLYKKLQKLQIQHEQKYLQYLQTITQN